MQWMQYAVDAVRSGIVVYVGGDIIFGAKKVKPEDTLDAVCSGCSTQWNSGIWWSGHCLWCRKVKPVNAVDSASTAYCVHCIHWLDLLAPKTMSPTTIYHYSTASTAYCIYCILCALGTVSTAYCIHCIHWLDLLHQRQCPHHHIPLFHCIHSILHLLHTVCTGYCVPLHTASTTSTGFDPFCTKDNVPTTIYHYSTASHCVLHPLV